MKKNTQGFSLVIAMGIVLVSSLLAYTILEYMIPFSQNVKGIENATKAYYKSNIGLEKGLYYFSTREDANIVKDIQEETNNYDSSYSGTTFTTFSSGSTLPRSGEGTSEFDTDWNTISIGNPIQLSVGYNFISDIENLQLQVRVPEINGVRGTLDASNGYISWILSSEDKALFASSGSVIKGSEINSTGVDISLKSKTGISYTGGTEVQKINFETFFETDADVIGQGGLTVQGIKCMDSSKKCILKFSIIRELKTKAGISLPYLEWKIESKGTTPSKLPLRYSVIKSTGKSGGYARELELKYPQDTVNQALDFAVFQ